MSSLDELFDDDAPELSHQQPSKKHHLERGGAPAAPFKIIIVGDSGVGKTCLLVRFVQGRYEGNEKPTVSVDVMSTEIDLGDSTVRFPATFHTPLHDSSHPHDLVAASHSTGGPFVVGHGWSGAVCADLVDLHPTLLVFFTAAPPVTASRSQPAPRPASRSQPCAPTLLLVHRFAPLSAPFFRQADGIVLVFDVGARKSFERLDSHWVDELATKAEPEANVLLIGSKADLPPESRAITDEEARAFAEAHGWDYFETSAKSGAHVRDAVHTSLRPVPFARPSTAVSSDCTQVRDAFYLLACNVMNRLLESDPRNLINDQKVALQAKGAKTRCC